MVFSNGEPVTATDVEASLANTEKSPLRSSLSAIENMTATNPDTLVVQLNRPTAGDFLWAMTYIDGDGLPRLDIATAATTPIGAGPFMLKSYQPGSSIDLVKNPKYWDSAAYPLGGGGLRRGESPAPGGQRHHLGRGGHDLPRARAVPGVKHDPNIGTAITQSYDYIVLRDARTTPPRSTIPRSGPPWSTPSTGRPSTRWSSPASAGRPIQPFPTDSPGYNKRSATSTSTSPQRPRPCWPPPGFPHGVSFKSDGPRRATPPSAGRPPSSRARWPRPGSTVSIQQIPGADILADVYLNKRATPS